MGPGFSTRSGNAHYRHNLHTFGKNAGASRNRARVKRKREVTYNDSSLKSASKKIAIDLLQARFWTASRSSGGLGELPFG